MKEKILIVDDCKIDRLIAERVLSKKYDCDFATNYLEAIEKIKNNHYEAIIVDFYLESGFDDDEVVKKINELRTYTNGSVFIVCSGNENITLHSNLNNVDHFISKKRFVNLPDRIELIKKFKKEVYEKHDNISTLLDKRIKERK